MNRNELINFLRENLTVDITTSQGYDYGCETFGITVSIGILNENGEVEEIVSGNDHISISTNN